MGETEILADLQRELSLDRWWEELLGQKPDPANFDIQKAIETIPRTEVTTAEEIQRKFNNILTYNEISKVWYLWDVRIHTPCAGDGIVAKVLSLYYRAVVQALDFVKEYYEIEARKILSSGVDKADEKAKAVRQQYDKGEISKHKSFRDRLSTSAGMAAVTQILKSKCDVPPEYYDNDQQWLVARNYVIDLFALADGDPNFLRTHSPDRPVTRFFNADYDPRSNLGHWDHFLESSIPDESMRNHLHRVIGASFMGRAKQRTIINIYGPPGSGKSVLLDTFFKLGKEGAGYSCLPDSKAATKLSGTNFDQDSMRSKRFIGISEPSSTESFDDDFFKKFTGDTWVETRTLNVKSQGWAPQGIPFIASNAPLRINSRDKAISERVQMISFPVEFVKDSPDPATRANPNIESDLLADASRILSWIIYGMVYYVKEGMRLQPPPSVLQLQGDITVSGSTALRWVEDYMEEGLLTYEVELKNLKYAMPVKDAYQKYQSWIIASGERRPLTLRFFTEDIEKKYGQKVKEGVYRFPNLAPTAEYRRQNVVVGFNALD